MKNIYFVPALLITIVMSLLPSIKTRAQGNLLLTPNRIVFEGQKRMQEINLANSGKDTVSYLVSFIEIKMNENGTFEQVSVPDSGQYFASSYLRFFPRRVTLAPNEAQTVKVQLTKAGQLSSGEYRSHLYFRAVPEEPALGEGDSSHDVTGLTVQLTPVFGITIPIIIRIGELTNAISLSVSALEMSADSTLSVPLTLNRSGDKSAYGDLKITFISSKGKTVQVAEVKGVAVYTPTTSRRLKMKLQNVPGVDYKTGKLHITYSTSSDTPPIQLAETELALY